MQLKDVYPPPQRLTPDRQERMRVVLLDAIQPATSPARPRTSRRRWQVAVAGATVVSVGALAWVFLGPGGTTAAAAWAPVPEQVTGQAAARLASSCEARVARGNGPVRLGTVAAALTEQRGASSAVLLLGTGREGICIDPHAGAGSTGGIIGPLVGATVQDPVPGGLTVDGTPGGPGLGLWAVYGRVASTRAATVLITLSDGREVTASVGHGHYLAWWPATTGADTVRVVDNSGHTIAAVRLGLTGVAPLPQHSR